MQYYFKKFVTVCKSRKKIHFYNGNKKGNSVSFEYTENNIELINELLLNGIDSNNLTDSYLYSELFNKDYLCENSRFQEIESINRNELFLNYLHEDIKKIDIEDAKETKILIYGAGAGGSTLIFLLAQFGFKNISIIDFDKVETSDVHRTMTFLKEDISKSKISVLKEKIKKNFSIDINTFEGSYSEKREIKKMINLIKPDFIINVCDPRPSFKLDLNELCFEYEIPYISASYSYEIISIGPIYVPLVTSCENSFDILVQKTYGEDFSFKNIERLFSEQLVHPSNTFNINLLASLAFKEILFFLLKKFDYCQTIGQRIYFNPLNYDISSRKADCDSNCKICK